MTWHLIFMACAGICLLAAVIGGALDLWRICPTTSYRSQTLVRFGMAVAGVSCTLTVLQTWLMGATWRERVHWELTADAGFAILALGLLLGAVERDVLRRTARQGVRHSHGDD